jgi:hypothetical protein
MKKLLMIATALMLSISANANVDPSTEVTPENAATTTTQTMTFGELKAIYGAENIELQGFSEMSDQTLIAFSKTVASPCGGGLQPCGAALAQARHNAQAQANACCCILYAGVECCDGNGTISSIIFLVDPKGCN